MVKSTDSAPGPSISTGQVFSLKVLTQQEKADIGGFSEPSKMPWLSYSISAERCKTGSKLRKIAGSVCSSCYACKGNYAWRSVQDALERRFNTLRKLSSWTRAMVRQLKARAARFVPSQLDPFPAFRWHDSGDLQSVRHLTAICRVAEQTNVTLMADGSVGPIRHWLPTREYGIVADYLGRGGVIPPNLVIRLSAHLVDGKAPDGFGLPVSSVHTDPSAYPDANVCPAYRQEGQCGSCRNCWDGNVRHVSYPVH